MITEHDAITGKTVEREPTAEELAQAELDAQAFAEREAEKEAKAEAKSAVLERLGITAEEAALLVG
jgi:hypothetical protein